MVKAKTIAGGAIAGIIGLTALSTLFGSWYSIDQSDRGILLRNGAYVETVGPGLHFKMPWIESVRTISIQTHTWDYKRVNSYSADQQPADADLSVTLELDPTRLGELATTFGSIDNMVSRVVTPAVNQEFKVVFGRFTAASAITDRGRLNTDAFKAIAAALAGYPVIHLKGLQVENIEFSQQYIASIEQRMQAEIEVQKVNQNVQREIAQAKITTTQAQAKADSELEVAKAQAQATIARGAAEGTAIRAKGEAEALALKAKADVLRDNPGIIALTTAERWGGLLPTTMVPGSAVPFVNVAGGKL